MKRHLVLLVWFTGWLLPVVGGGSLVVGADITASTASNAFAEHLAQLSVPEGFTLEKPPE